MCKYIQRACRRLACRHCVGQFRIHECKFRANPCVRQCTFSILFFIPDNRDSVCFAGSCRHRQYNADGQHFCCFCFLFIQIPDISGIVASKADCLCCIYNTPPANGKQQVYFIVPHQVYSLINLYKTRIFGNTAKGQAYHSILLCGKPVIQTIVSDTFASVNDHRTMSVFL